MEGFFGSELVNRCVGVGLPGWRSHRKQWWCRRSRPRSPRRSFRPGCRTCTRWPRDKCPSWWSRTRCCTGHSAAERSKVIHCINNYINCGFQTSLVTLNVTMLKTLKSPRNICIWFNICLIVWETEKVSGLANWIFLQLIYLLPFLLLFFSESSLCEADKVLVTNKANANKTGSSKIRLKTHFFGNLPNSIVEGILNECC